MNGEARSTIPTGGPWPLLPWSRPLRRASFLGLVVGLCAAAAPLPEDVFPPELVDFVPHGKNPVFTARGKGHWDASIRERGWILRDRDTYRMWFTGYDGTPRGLKMLGYATSRDGVTWVRHQAKSLSKN